MEAILKEIHLDSVSQNFLEERIQPENVSSLSDEELQRLGVSTLGDRIRLRELCKDKVTNMENAVVNSDRQTTSSGRQSVSREVLQERMSLFSSRGSRRGSRGDRNRKKPATRTWTIQCVCLADRHQTKTPTCTERQSLFQAGLGIKKIKVNLEDDESTVLEKITSSESDDAGQPLGFPQLKDCGGFEMLHCISGSKIIKPINCCWAAKDLKANVGPQSKIYLRPIQKHLSTASLTPENKSQVKERCIACNKDFLIRDLRYHTYICKATQNIISSDSSDEELPPAFSSTATTTGTRHGDQSETQTVEVQPVNSGSSQSPLPQAVMTEPEHDEHQERSGALSIDDIVAKVVDICKTQSINNPVEILRCLQQQVVTGRALEIENVNECSEGATNFILINRENLLTTAFDELSTMTDFRHTLEVQFYGEQAEDYGGPRKEFFRLVLCAIKERYFDQGIRDHLSEDYYMVGVIMGLSVIQNGKIPTFLNEDMLVQIFQTTTVASRSLYNIRSGLMKVGIYQICQAMPLFLHLFRPSPASALTLKKLTSLLKPDFSESGSNKRRFENEVYSAFCKYLREAASGRRGDVSLAHVLQFTTGSDEEPLLGFKLHPSLIFTEAETSFIPLANTCSNTLKLPHGSLSTTLLPQSDKLFELHDYAFLNAFFGNI